jgi:hypothetical protein
MLKEASGTTVYSLKRACLDACFAFLYFWQCFAPIFKACHVSMLFSTSVARAAGWVEFLLAF